MIEIINMNWINDIEYTANDFASVYLLYSLVIAGVAAWLLYENIEVEEWWNENGTYWKATKRNRI